MTTYKKRKVEDRIVELEMLAYGSLDICIKVENMQTTTDEIIADITIVDGDISTLYPGCTYPIHMFSNCETKSFDITLISIEVEKILDRLTKAEWNEEDITLERVKRYLSQVRIYYTWLSSSSSGESNLKSPKHYADALVNIIKGADDFLTRLHEPVG